MATTIYTSKGEAIYVGGTITDQTGADISDATIIMALTTSKDVPPSSGSAPDIDEEISNTERLVKKLIANPYTAGTYYAWARITDTPEIDWVVFNGEDGRPEKITVA